MLFLDMVCLTVAAPKGTFNPEDGATTPTDCTDCTGGNYCDGVGLSEPKGEKGGWGQRRTAWGVQGGRRRTQAACFAGGLPL
jgi:hypothetical protein